jgi:hypothetical protein
LLQSFGAIIPEAVRRQPSMAIDFASAHANEAD